MVELNVDLADPFISTMVLIAALALVIVAFVFAYHVRKDRQTRRLIYRRRRRRPESRTRA